jgi:hypothetical protein
MRVDATVMFTDLPLRLSTMPPVEIVLTSDDDDGAMPAELRQWLVQLRLLEGVPFSYVVPDTGLLPQESIRWFYIDRRWTDALVQGALSVGTCNTDDRAQLSAAYPACRDELDQEERNVRRGPDTPRWLGDGGPISGFLLRSAAVSGWPGLHVQGFSSDPGTDVAAQESYPPRIRLLRLERLAPAVLLCLFDGIPEMVRIEEPRQGVQFGFDHDDPNSTAMSLQPRNSDFSYSAGPPLPVPFRTGSPGVVDIQSLERSLAALGDAGPDNVLDSAEYAQQLIRFPYRRVYGGQTSVTISEAFRATVAYKTLSQDLFTKGGA